MSNVLVFCETQSNKLKKGSLEMLTAAQGSGRKVAAILFGKEAASLTSTVSTYGVEKIFVCSDEKMNAYNPEVFLSFLNQVGGQYSFDTLLASSTSLAKDLLPRWAAKLNAAVASDCTELKIDSQTLSVRRPMYSGKCTAEVKFSADCKKLILMRPNQLPVLAGTGGSAQTVEVSIQAQDLKTIVKDIVKGASEKLDLTEANIIVSGGRGMKGPENFKLLDELATVLGATVGASRAVCDAGWVPHSMQVGQTGKTVAPSLYIAVGISGAIQHLAGMTGSKVIVAINNDPEAPIFQKANFGIVGDAFEVLPLLTEEFKKLLN